MSCCVGQYDLCINQYATFGKVFIWLLNTCGCGTVGSAPSPVNLTGYTANMQFRVYQLAPMVLFDASPYIVLGGTAGTITLTIPASLTAGFTWWTGFYDLILTDPNGSVTRLLEGSVTVSPGVTP
jgi:hypothetical protein